MEELESIELEEATVEPGDFSQPASLRQRLILLIVAASVLILDQYTKILVERVLDLYEIYTPFPAIDSFFRITHATNTGMALGLFPDGSLFFGLMAVVVSIVIVYYNHTLPKGNIWLRVALGLTLGGALGNLIDRLRQGHVTDFLDFGPIPIFNVADTAVVCGAILLGFLMLLDARQAKKIADEGQADQAEFDSTSSNLTEESSSIQ